MRKRGRCKRREEKMERKRVEKMMEKSEGRKQKMGNGGIMKKIRKKGKKR